jgi:hypothetical protein
MQTSKIAQLRENVGTWNASDGTLFYKHNVQLENGVQGQALGKSPNAPYQVGDAVEYEEKRTQDGTRLKIRKPSQGGGGYGGGQRSGGNNPQRDGRIMRQTAMKVAAHIVGEGKHFSEYVNVANQCVKYFESDTNTAATPPVDMQTRGPEWTSNGTSSNDFPF